VPAHLLSSMRICAETYEGRYSDLKAMMLKGGNVISAECC
jgi:hypothetical protein